MPKEMLPVVDKPIIQYVVEEAVASGIEDIIIVTGWHKRSIEDHFDFPFELEKRLRDAGKEKQADEVVKISNLANFIYVRQKGPYGNGTPVLNARRVIGDEPAGVGGRSDAARDGVELIERQFALAGGGVMIA